MPTNGSADPLVIDAYDTVLDFAPWRTNPDFIGAILVAADLPPTRAGRLPPPRQHLAGVQPGAANKACRRTRSRRRPAAPTVDIDNQARPGQGGFDIGADELPSPTADLSITKTDGVETISSRWRR